MTTGHCCFCELTPLYALDMLSDVEHEWVEQQVAECPDLVEELADYQTAVAAIPYSVPLMPMADGLKLQLFDRLDLSLSTAQPQISPSPALSPFLAVRSQDIQWQSHLVPGVAIAIFHTDPIKREITGVLRAEAGVRYPLHYHADIEEIYMLSGELAIGEEIYGTGDYIRSHTGSAHAPYTADGCVFFFRTSIDDEYPESVVSDTRLIQG
ncbi:MAG: anti-sigma factor [Leptolyngbyaceae cyanobacterium CRU_2_3]|nr:anti-sigma factor [Leptolyngbyaceae cyanobacterium CRU_2_3]